MWTNRIVPFLELALLWTLVLSGLAITAAFLLGLGVALPLYLMWQGGWTAMAGIALWMVCQAAGRILNKRT